MLPTIIDIEASGFGRHSYPIEVGVVLPDRRLVCNLIKPAAHWTFWDREAEAIHGIPRQLLLERGEPAEKVAERLNRLLQGRTVYSDAWGHDLSWLGKLYDQAGMRQRFTLESLRRLIGEQQLPHWHPTKAAVMQELKLNRHRASTDAMILQETYRRVCAGPDAPDPAEAAREGSRGGGTPRP